MLRRLILSGVIVMATVCGLAVHHATASAQTLSPEQYYASPQAIPGGPYYGTVGIPVNFFGTVRTTFGFGTTQFQWTFGDGAVGYGASISHVYLAPGTFVVTLQVTDPSGLGDTESTTATIQPGGAPYQPFQVNPGGPYTGVVGAPVTFSGGIIGVAYGGLLQYTWNFGDGTTATGQTVPHVYASAGMFTVTLTAGSPAQTAVGQTTASIGQTLQVSAGVSTTGFAGHPVPFSASVVGAANPQFTWSFGDGATASGPATSHTYQAPGSYTASVAVVDAATGQRDADSITVTINPSLTVDALGPYRGTAGSTIGFSSTVAGAANPTYVWNFGDGTTGAGASPTHTYDRAGSYTATLSVGDPATGASAADFATVTVIDAGPVVVYQAGWNLVAGPQGTSFAKADSPLYTLQPSDTSYEVLKASPGVEAGYGYWAYFAQPTSVTLSGSSTDSAAVQVPGGQWVLVGNPSATSSVRIHDATYAFGWDPQTQTYKQVTSLAPGQAAWVYVANTDVVALQP